MSTDKYFYGEAAVAAFRSRDAETAEVMGIDVSCLTGEHGDIFAGVEQSAHQVDTELRRPELPIGAERQERIRDIRERKGHLLGRGLVASGSDPGYVPAMPPEDRMKFSVPVGMPVEDEYGVTTYETVYEYRGQPANSVRNLPSNQSEYVKPVDGHQHEACGRTALGAAVERQQIMLAEVFQTQQQTAEMAREARLNRYVKLLRDPIQLADAQVAEEFDGFVGEFYLPRNAGEEGRIIDAGGITYGL